MCSFLQGGRERWVGGGNIYRTAYVSQSPAVQGLFTFVWTYDILMVYSENIITNSVSDTFYFLRFKIGLL